MNAEFKMTLLNRVKQIVADTYLAYGLVYTGSEAYDSYLWERELVMTTEAELVMTTEALGRCYLGQDAIMDLFNEITCLIERDRKQRF